MNRAGGGVIRSLEVARGCEIGGCESFQALFEYRFPFSFFLKGNVGAFSFAL